MNSVDILICQKPPTPIATLFEQLRDEQKFASQGNEIIHNIYLIRWEYDNIKATALFDKDCEKWCKRETSTQT